MGRWEGIFIWIAIGFYGLSFLIFLTSLVFRKPRGVDWAFWVAITGFLSHTGSILARFDSLGHFPVMHTYETSLGGSWFLVALYFILYRLFPAAKPLGVAVAPLAVLLLGNGILTGAVLQPLEPPYRSKWLYVHVMFAQVSFGAYVLAAVYGVLYLVKEREDAGGKPAGRLPEAKLLDELSFRLILFGFFAESVMLASGAIWAHGLWGRYWAWDPVENWSLITWLTYGLNLHLRTTLGWRGKRAAWLAVGSIAGVIILFFGIGFESILHTMMF